LRENAQADIVRHMLSRAGLIDSWFIKQPRLRRLITHIIYGRADRTISLFGLTLAINSAKENGYLRASSSKLSVFRHETSVLFNLASLIDNDTIFIDIGANVGLYASAISRLRAVKTGLRVFAFEVNPDTFSRLVENAVRYGFDARCVALGSRKERQTFVQGAVSHVTTTLERQNSYNIPSETFVQDCVPLSDVALPDEGHIVMKIDIEGQEIDMLRGAKRFFENGRIKAVYVDGCSAEVLSFLKDFGFVFYDGRTFERSANPAYVLAISSMRASVVRE
jgi:FkbM family methyltransferase